MEVITGMFKLNSAQDTALRDKFKRLPLDTQTEVSVKNSWIEDARDVARQIAVNNGEVTIEDVLDEFALPDEMDPRIVGGVLRHPDFVRTGNRSLMAKDRRYKTVGVFSLRRRVVNPITNWD